MTGFSEPEYPSSLTAVAVPQPATQATMVVGWSHPRLGRIRELVCDSHEQVVLSSVANLGIGCIGERVTGLGDCRRCVAEAASVSTRDYVHMAAVVEVSR